MGDRLFGSHSAGLEVHPAEYSPSRFGRCPCRSNLGMAPSVSVRAVAGNRQEDPAAVGSGKADIVVGGTVGDTAAAGIAEMEIVTLDIAAEKSIACTEVVRMN
jgi:hypothetical protein